MSVYGGIETGGTRWRCAIGTGPNDLVSETSFSTTTPEETLDRAAAFFESGEPVAALGEHRWGAAQGLDTFVYLTIGTGIGGGVLAAGRLVHGLAHPEFGHLRVPHDRVADPYPGFCPYHGDCWEGLAAGPAIEARWGKPAEQLLDVAEVWELEARYVALGLVSVIAILSPQLVVLGGGVGGAAPLLPLVRRDVVEVVGGYVQAPEIVPPGLGDRSGVLGAIALALALDL